MIVEREWTEPSRKTLVLVYRHKLIMESLKASFEAIDDIEVVASVDTGAVGLTIADAVNPRVVVVDGSLSDMTPIMFAHRLNAQSSKARIVVLSGRDEPDTVRRTLGADISGFILKKSSFAQLVYAVRAAAEGASYLDPHLAHTIVTEHRRDLDHRNAKDRLTSREDEVLRLVAKGHTAKEIGHTLGIAISSVEVTKLRAAAKLALTSRAQIVRYAVAQGWLHDYTS